MVDHAPTALKNFAIQTFGTADKVALIVGIVGVLAALAAGVGVIATRRRWAGMAGIVALAVVGGAAALGRPGSTAMALLPSVTGGIVGLSVLNWLLAGRRRPGTEPGGSGLLERRRLLTGTLAVAGLGAATFALGRGLRRRLEVTAARARIQLPPPASPAPALPAGIDPPVPGLTPYVTPTRDFYRIDTALVVPQVDPDSWRLKVHGLVERELQFTLEELLAFPLVERHLTLVCVSNEVGGGYAGNARWLGVRLADVLNRCGVRPDATQLVSRSVDGYTAGTPVETVLDGRDALIAVGMNGEPLPTRHGFPARLVVPGLYGYVSATKWLTELELTTFEAFDAYWVRRGWASRAPVKTMSRIDTPRGLQRLPAGKIPIAGVAWAPHRGIDRVEVRVDDGPWRLATLAPGASDDTWRQWVLEWDASPGRHVITCRATDGASEVQTEMRARPMPDGATGWHEVLVTVT